MCAFPHGKYDDQVDSLSQFLKWAPQSARNDISAGGMPRIVYPDGSPPATEAFCLYRPNRSRIEQDESDAGDFLSSGHWMGFPGRRPGSE